MNRVLLEVDEVRDGVAVLRGRRAQHVREVLRSEPGDALRVGVVRGPIGAARINHLDDELVRMTVELETSIPVAPAISIVMAVPRPKVVTRVVRSLASMRIARLDLINAWKVDKSYLSSKKLTDASLREAAWQGCEQGGHTWLPDIRVHKRFVEYLDQLGPDSGVRLVATARGGRPLEEVYPPGTNAPTVLAIGPEGGWTERERDSLVQRGFRACQMGDAIMTVETAAVALVSSVDLLRRLPAAAK